MLHKIISIIYRRVNKKKQDEHLNELKVKKINKVLIEILSVLEIEESKIFLDLLEVDELPTNSDAVMILAQFQVAMNNFHSKHHRWNMDEHKDIWYTN